MNENSPVLNQEDISLAERINLALMETGITGRLAVARIFSFAARKNTSLMQSQTETFHSAVLELDQFASSIYTPTRWERWIARKFNLRRR